MFGGLTDNGFRPNNDIPDLTGKVILVTGGKVGSNFAPASPAEMNKIRKLGSGTRVGLSTSKAQSEPDISGCTKYREGPSCSPQD